MNLSVESAYFSDKEYTGSNHYHDCHQLVFTIKGHADVTVNSRTYTATTGSIIIINRMESHSIRSSSCDYERYILRINPLSPPGEQREYSLFLNRPGEFIHLIDVSDQIDDFRGVFEEIIKENRENGILAEKMQQLLISKLLIMLYRKHSSVFAPIAGDEFELVFSIQRDFENNCRKKYTLSSLAREHHVSISTISHQFKKITGLSVFDYLFSIRISSAKYFLANSDMTVGEIVEKCGFSDASNFSRSFRKEVGITPSEFRKKYGR